MTRASDAMDRSVLASIPADGARTHQIARSLPGTTTPHVRRACLRLERRGLIVRAERYSAVNDIYWLPAVAVASGEAR